MISIIVIAVTALVVGVFMYQGSWIIAIVVATCGYVYYRVLDEEVKARKLEDEILDLFQSLDPKAPKHMTIREIKEGIKCRRVELLFHGKHTPIAHKLSDPGERVVSKGVRQLVHIKAMTKLISGYEPKTKVMYGLA